MVSTQEKVDLADLKFCVFFKHRIKQNLARHIFKKCTKRLLIGFQIRVHDWVVGSIPSSGMQAAAGQ